MISKYVFTFPTASDREADGWLQNQSNIVVNVTRKTYFVSEMYCLKKRMRELFKPNHEQCVH